MRRTGLLLFDIDGTLTRTQNGFIPFNDAILRTFGVPGDIRTVVPDGNTDPLILEEIFAKADIKAEITEESWTSFATILAESYSRAIQRGITRVDPLPGVLELLKELSGDGHVRLGVVTGNLEVTAQIKLKAAGLKTYLHLGAYGSDSRDRNDLPAVAKERWEREIGMSIAPQQCIIVGDTSKDLEAARKNQMKCLLVGTGRYPLENLDALAPDGYLTDFADAKSAVGTLLKLFR